MTESVRVPVPACEATVWPTGKPFTTSPGQELTGIPEPCGKDATGRYLLFGVVKWLCVEHQALYASSGALDELQEGERGAEAI